MNKCGKWALNVLIGLDQLGSAITGGDPDETISSRLGKMKLAHGGEIPWHHPVARVLDCCLEQIDPHHSIDAIELDEGKDALMNETKPGYKTTEFWLTLLTQAVGILTMTGVIKPEAASTYLQGGEQLIGGLMTVIPQIAYAFSRGKAKTTAAAKILLLFLLPAFLLMPAPAAAQIGTWYPANQVTMAWDAVTKDAQNNPLPAAEIRYKALYVNEADTQKASPVTVGTTTATSQVFTFQGEGRFILGVQTERVQNNVVVSTSTISWSDNPTACQDQKTFGVSRYADPAAAGTLRLQTQ